jgi:hypothetical protein
MCGSLGEHAVIVRNMHDSKIQWQTVEFSGISVHITSFCPSRHTGIHLDMVDNRPHTLMYCWAIEENADYFRDQMVLDVGCGSGILSLFAVRTGAHHVYAVECTLIYQVAKEIGYSDRIDVIHLRVEDSALPEQVTALRRHPPTCWFIPAIRVNRLIGAPSASSRDRRSPANGSQASLF